MSHRASHVQKLEHCVAWPPCEAKVRIPAGFGLVPQTRPISSTTSRRKSENHVQCRRPNAVTALPASCSDRRHHSGRDQQATDRASQPMATVDARRHMPTLDVHRATVHYRTARNGCDASLSHQSLNQALCSTATRSSTMLTVLGIAAMLQKNPCSMPSNCLSVTATPAS